MKTICMVTVDLDENTGFATVVEGKGIASETLDTNELIEVLEELLLTVTLDSKIKRGRIK